jgi:bicarbonate transport system ATP-binding protein
MNTLVNLEQVQKCFFLPGGTEYHALDPIDLKIQAGELVSLIGHSGCGKSTLLNLVAGLLLPTDGLVLVDGDRVSTPGPERMVVFQHYSLLPWLTARQNIALAVNAVLTDLGRAEREATVEEHIRLVGLQHAADKHPAELSGGMKQRVAIARALALRPKLLLLDEPFGALDALTRGNLQEQLMRICEAHRVTTLMVTHDVDEAVLLSDRVVMLTNGPGSRIGNVLEIAIPRPRRRMDVVNHPSYYSYRSEIIYFLNQQKRIKQLRARSRPAVGRHGLEKVNLEIGFVPLSACAPLAVAKEHGFFARHGLEEVNLVRETSWRGVRDGIAGGWLDAAQMPAGMPLWMSLGGGDAEPTPVVSALTLTRNGNAVTLHKRFLAAGVRNLRDLRTWITENSGRPPVFGVVHPSSMHNLLLRYWLAAGGIDPDRDIRLQTIPPAQLVANLRSGTIDGFCVGEPWNLRAAMEGTGFIVATDLDIWMGHPGKVLGVREVWSRNYPNTHVALVKALLDACRWCEDPDNHAALRELLSRREYLSTDPGYIELGGDGGLVDATTGMAFETAIDPVAAARRHCAHHRFFLAAGNRPSRTEHLWMMTQMARWGDVPFPRNWVEVLERVCRVDVFSTAARELGVDISYQRGAIELFDDVPFLSEDPVGYLNGLAIKHDIYMAEVSLTRRDQAGPGAGRTWSDTAAAA